MSKYQKIGTFFKKENIFLGTLWTYPIGKDYSEKNNSEFKIMDRYEQICDITSQFANMPQYKIVIAYKCDDGYIVFQGRNFKKINGDDSDKNGELKDLVSIWEYYIEEQLSETTLKSGEHIIIDSIKSLRTPKQKYKKDYFDV